MCQLFQRVGIQIEMEVLRDLNENHRCEVERQERQTFFRSLKSYKDKVMNIGSISGSNLNAPDELHPPSSRLHSLEVQTFHLQFECRVRLQWFRWGTIFDAVTLERTPIVSKRRRESMVSPRLAVDTS